MFGLGIGELLLILAVALIVVGPKRLPDVGKKLGELFRQLRETAETVKETVTKELEETPPSPPKDKPDGRV